jgi:hypothetical protein
VAMALGISAQASTPLALLIEDQQPWKPDGGISNEKTLQDLQSLGKLTYDKINSSQLASTDLSKYTFVSYASDQPQGYYNNIAASLPAVTTYVENGGLLIGHACIYGWQSGQWTTGNYLPGGVGVNIGNVGEYSDSVSIVDPSSPIITGPYGTVTDASLQGWNWSTHGYFTGLPAGAQTIISVMAGDVAQPAYVDYKLGLGEVRATMMTLEWNQGQAAGDRYIFRENEYAYATQGANPGVPDAGSSMLLLSFSLMGLAGLRRKLARV